MGGNELWLCSSKRGHGARVVVPSPGKFVTGTLYLKTGVELYLEDGATRIGSTNRFDYHFGSRWMALLMAENESDFKVTGASHFSLIIDGQGQQLAVNIDNLIHEGKIIDPEYTNRPNEKRRPQIIEFINCRNITISNIQINNPSGWNQTYKQCTGLNLLDVVVNSDAYWNNNGSKELRLAQTR